MSALEHDIIWENKEFLGVYFGDAAEAVAQFCEPSRFFDHDSQYRLASYRRLSERFGTQLDVAGQVRVVDIQCGNGLGGLFLTSVLAKRTSSIELLFVDSSEKVCRDVVPKHVQEFEKRCGVRFRWSIRKTDDRNITTVDGEATSLQVILWERQIGVLSHPVEEIRQRIARHPRAVILIGHYTVGEGCSREMHLRRYQSAKAVAMLDSVKGDLALKTEEERNDVEMFVEDFALEDDEGGQLIELGFYLDIHHSKLRRVVHKTRQYSPRGWASILERALPKSWNRDLDFPVSGNGLTYTCIWPRSIGC